ncbi:hypothetical protein SETIT_4G094800v2 [Setaria italica]|uniref:Pectinesterase inhibitor domain-containing protein n=1 Tax=Setaria italica TaxID=4555 RepID=A0A368QSF4_SETIT|nr:hypothetical protein SETIT_4G094800v2 [Setaria italica]
MLLLRTHLLLLLRAASPLPSPIHHRVCSLLSTSASTSPFAAPLSLEDYHITACGLAPTQARKIAKKAFDGASKDNKKSIDGLNNCRLNYASNPNAILALLSDVDLSHADITTVVTADPLLLRSKPNNIGPCLFGLHDHLGLSAPQIIHFTRSPERASRPLSGFW